MKKKRKNSRSIIAFLLAAALILQPFSGYVGEVRAAEEGVGVQTEVESTDDGKVSTSEEEKSASEKAAPVEDSPVEEEADASATDQPEATAQDATGAEETKKDSSETGQSAEASEQTEKTDEAASPAVQAESDVLTISENETRTLALDADTTYEKIEMAEESELTVNTNGYTLTLTKGITGSGKVTLQGKGTVALGDDSDDVKIETASLTLKNITVDAKDKSVTATEEISVKSSTVSNASLFGYADDVSGEKEIKLEEVTLSNVDAFGVSEKGSARVSYDSSKFTSTANSTLYQDYALTYFYNGETLEKNELGDAYADSYRVKTSGTTNTIVGYHTSFDKYEEASSITLPKYSEKGYTYVGWYVDGAATSVTELGEGTGAHKLTAALKAVPYTVTLDLGYMVTDDTNDDSMPTRMTLNEDNQTQTYSKNPNETITLPTPQRFGYDFVGWELNGSSSVEGGQEYTVNVNDSDDNNQIYFVAKWQAKEFGRVRLDLGTGVPVENITIDGQTVQSYLDTYKKLSMSSGGTVIVCEILIKYGESLQEYLARLGLDGGLPTLTDSRTGAEQTAFSGWKTLVGVSVNNDSIYATGGLVSNRTTGTLAEYQTKLQNDGVLIQAKWGTQFYKVINLPQNDNWSYAYKTTDNEQNTAVDVKTDGTRRYIEVPQGSTVILSCKADTDETITQWAFSATDGSSLPVSQETYTGGASYSYTFTMPYCDVKASYWAMSDTDHPVYVNIAESPITFAENVSFKGRSGLSGFWYTKDMTQKTDGDMTVNAMTPVFYTTDISNTAAYSDVTGNETDGYYFYEYNFSKYPFYVTSKDTETQNPLVLVNKADIYLKKCKLVGTDTFNENAVGMQLDGKDLYAFAGSGSLSLKDYGNIVVDRSTKNYAPTLHIDGENTVACISTHVFSTNASHYNAITVSGTSKEQDSLTLGSVMGCFAVTFEKLTIHEYNKKDTTEDFRPIVTVVNRGDASIPNYITDCVLDAPNRAWCGTYRTNYTNSQIDIGEFPELYYYTSQPSYSNCKVHVHGDMYMQFTLSVQGNTSIIVDGSMIQKSQNSTHIDTINTSGVVVVKGNRCDLGVFRMVKGTLICNQLMISQDSEFSGGTVITNLLSERADYNGNSAEKNADGYPFGRTVSTSSGTYNFTFRGSKVYLFGQYQTVENGSSDARLVNTTTALDTDNPVKKFAEIYTDSADSSVTITDEDLTSAVEAAATAGAKECVALGKTEYAEGSSVIRNVNISGGTICAAGNITFYNDTTVSGGSVISYGSFASKRDLFIQKGTVTAKEVGNAYNASRTENGNQRWAQTVITGGSVNTDRIGALKGKIRDVEARSYVSIGDAATINPFTEDGDVAVSSDLKVNYHLLNGLTVADDVSNPVNVRYQCEKYTTSKSLDGQLKLSEEDGSKTVTFTKPKDTAGAAGSWTFDSVQGEVVENFDNQGYLNGNSAAGYVYSTKKTIELYAVKNSNTLTIRAGEDKITSLKESNGSDENDIIFTAGVASVTAGSIVSFAVPADMKDKVIVNYYDDNKVLYNAQPEVVSNANADGTYTCSFTMPRTDTEIWVSDTFDLYLNEYPVTFTKDGFATEYGTASGSTYTFDESRSFSYQGTIQLSERSMTTERNENYFKTIQSSSVSPLTYSGTASTSNRIHFTSDFDNLSGGESDCQIILSNLIQKYTEIGTEQTILEDGAKVWIKIDGHVGLYRVKVPETSDIKISGYHTEAGSDGRPQDSLWLSANKAADNAVGISLGNQKGKCGNITLDTLFLCQKNANDGQMGSNYYTDPTATLTMKNCTMVNTNLYESTGIAMNLKEVVLDNCKLDIAISNSWPGTLITYCKKVSLVNGTEYNLNYGAQYISISPFTVIKGPGTNDCYKNYYKNAEFVIDSATMNIALNTGSNQRIYHCFGWMYNVKLAGTGKLTASRYLSLDTLTMGGGSSVKVGDNDHCGYLFCSDIQVADQAKLDAGYIALSGFDTLVNVDTAPNFHNDSISSEEVWRSNIENNIQPIRDGKNYRGLVMTGGTVTASQFVGGDVNSKIKISGGTLNAQRIGTYGAYMGILSYEPTVDTDENWCLFYEKVPTAGESSVVDITGGTVNVMENGYLGGMTATVNITGGEVCLANGAVLGITEAQKEKLRNYYLSKNDSIAAHTATNIQIAIGGTAKVEADYASANVAATGSICMPYGDLKITENAQVKVAGIHGLGGTVTVEETNVAYSNPYTKTGETNAKDTVGVLVTNGTDKETDKNILEAQTIQVAKGARIYAPKVRAVVENQTGGIDIADPTISGNEGTGVYCVNYLVVGTGGTKDYNNTAGDKQNIFNTHPEIGIVYELNPQSTGNEMEDADAGRILNDPENVESYTYEATNDVGEYKVALKDASCTGYNFDGWYTSADYTQKYDGYISTNSVVTEQIVLYAKWSKIQVKFALVIDQASHGSSIEDMDTEFVGLDQVWEKKTSGDSGSVYYQSAVPVSIPYGGQILGTSGINLEKYETNTMLALSVTFDSAWTAYKGNDLNDDVNKVSLNLAEYYKEYCTAGNDVILLHVNNMTNRDARITFDLNRGSSMSSIPVFTGGSSQAKTIVLEIYKTLGDSELKAETTEADKSYVHSSGLTIPTATGYTFYGWNTSKDATYDTKDGWVNSDSKFENNATVYAIWRANTYKVRFQVEDQDKQDSTVRSFVTADDTEPGIEAAETSYLDYTWVYDTSMTSVPFGWREGYTFDASAGWKYQYTEEGETKTGYVTEGMTLNTAGVAALNIAAGDPDGKPTETALVVEADFKPVKVTYHLDGGTMGGEDGQSVTLDSYMYGDALCGYTADAVESEAQEVFGEYSYTSNNGSAKKYGVISTTAAYYAANNGYVTKDYRNALSRKGYTFKGWNTKADGTGETVGSLPRFTDVELYAQWEANTYDLKLYEKGSNYTYTDTQFTINTGAPDSGVTAKVKVGEVVSVDKINWPNRDGDWYAYSSDYSDHQRYLLGFTFASLDPGNANPNAGDGYTTVYQNYAAVVTNMVNGGTLFRNKTGESDGTVFTLPDDQTYQKQIEKSYECKGGRMVTDVTVADYPSGSTIAMYAVYNERSLIFMERYTDPDGNVVSEVKYSGPVDTYYDYPGAYDTKGDDGNYTVKSRKKIEEQGYSLIGWYVNGTETKFAVNADDYTRNLNAYKEEAVTKGTYDVIVYTVFSAVKTQTGLTLTANEDPTATSWPVSDSFTIPNSMQDGKLSMQVSGTVTNGLQFVSDTEMESHLYESSWGGLQSNIYSADTTVAVRVTATSPDGNTTASGYVTETGMVKFGTGNDWQVVGAGWTIQLELIHSRVMTEQAKQNMTFDLKFCFTSKDSNSYESENNLLKDQWILCKGVKVNLKPSMYTVTYTLDLPEASSKLDVTAWNGFTRPQGDNTRITWSVKVPYGKELHQAPAIVGYTTPVTAYKTAWTLNDSNTNTYTSLTMDMRSANGQIAVSSSYTAKEYTLTADTNLSDWVISYTDGANGTTETTLSSGNSAKVKYHSVITIKPADGKEPVAEFVTLTMHGDGSTTETSKLSEYTGYGSSHTGNAYSLAMLDGNLDIGWKNVQMLYLDDGSIALDAASYQQNDETHSWTGKYVIWQNEQNDATEGRDGGQPENTLKISGNLSDREIRVGNLQITADDSICLEEDAKAVLTLNYTDVNTNTAKPSTVSAKNILVSAGNDGTKKTALTLRTGVESGKAEVILTPAREKAAIGGSTGVYSGNVTVQNMKLQLHMPAGSTASGIGSGSSSSGNAYNTVNVSGCEVNVEEEADAMQQYKGAWIGGKTVAAVQIQNSVITPMTETAMAGPVITDGGKVTIDSSSIGTESVSVHDPVYAENALTIKNSTIYQNISVNLHGAQVKVPIGTSVANATTITNSTIKSILNPEYVSELYGGRMQIMDSVSDVKIGTTQIVEISNGDLEIGDTGYTQGGVTHNHSGSYQLLENVKKPDVAPTLTVNAFGSGADITAKSDLTFGKVSVNTDMTLELKGNVTTTADEGNTLGIAEGKTLTVTADADAAYELELGAGFDQSMRGNYIQTNGKLSGSSLVVGGDLTLHQVTADAGNGELGSLDTGASAADLVTTVTVDGGSVSAGTIGAIGVAQQTFTFLKMDNDPTWTGKLVQDRYRIAYDTSGDSHLDTTKLATVVRTETTKTGGTETVRTISPENGVPGKPEETETELFSCWYMINKNNERQALMADSSGQVPAGLTGKVSLGAETLADALALDVSAPAEDSTQTLTLHAWLKAVGTATIKKGRFVSAFNDGAERVSGVPTNGAWTAQLVCTGGNTIAGRDYQIQFANALPKGTELTLAQPVTKDGVTTTTYYRYAVGEANVTAVNFSAFTKMGTTERMSLTADTTVESETFLLSVDYEKAKTAPGDGKVSFILLPSGSEKEDKITLTETALSYAVTETHKGNISASGDTVTITTSPEDSERLTGQKIFLAAKLSGGASDTAVKVPFGATAKLTGSSTSTGTWISRDTVLFEISDVKNTAERTVAFTGLNAGSYQLTWTLVYGTDARANTLGHTISNTAEGTVTVADKVVNGKQAPCLSVQMTGNTHVIAAGETINFTYTTTESAVTAKVQKQGMLGSFSDDDSIKVQVTGPTNGAGTASVTFTNAGTYRICFSINDKSIEDDVYFVYIVE